MGMGGGYQQPYNPQFGGMQPQQVPQQQQQAPVRYFVCRVLFIGSY